MKEVTYEDWQKNPMPRMMWVWNSNVEDKVPAKVICVIKDKPYRVITVTDNDADIIRYRHCAEIEEPKTRRMTKKELSRWLREKPTREFKYNSSIFSYVYSTCTYDENEEEEEVREDVVIREDDGEWREPLVEVEE